MRSIGTRGLKRSCAVERACRSSIIGYDHPFHTPLEHALGIDFVNEAETIMLK
jgi:hypothetical protein